METMKGKKIHLSQTWVIGEVIDTTGGFAEVYYATGAEGEDCVAKFVPNVPGADREQLFGAMPASEYIVPVVDSGEFDGNLILVMPRAETSLRKHLTASGGSLSVDETVRVLKDVSDALIALDGRVVHRDIKPENILLLNGHWCLADFGISRYNDEDTATYTRKFYLTKDYAAPERWKMERASVQTDIYSLGVTGFELLSGRVPFSGTKEEVRRKHLEERPPRLDNVPLGLSALINECLHKPLEARPTPASLRKRLEWAASSPPSAGLAALQQANSAEVDKRLETDGRLAQKRSEHEHRVSLANAGEMGYLDISASVLGSIEEYSSAAHISRGKGGGWLMRLGDVELSMSPLWRNDDVDWWSDLALPFEVIVAGHICIRIPPGRDQYDGRGHSLWYCDCMESGRFGWYEMAFMYMPLVQRRSAQDPFYLDPGPKAAEAFKPVLGSYQLAWPLTALTMEKVDRFIEQWSLWFAQAFEGRLRHPSHMPERKIEETWRKRSS